MSVKGATDKIVPSVRNEYGALARAYEHRWRRYLEVSIERTLAMLEPRDHERILDAGCGTGLLLRRIAATAPQARLVGIDLTAAMIRQADSSTSNLVLGDVRHLPFADASLDAVVIASVLQYLPDPATALAEAARVLRPAGRVVITLWDSESRRMRLFSRWLRCRNRADIHLHAPGDVTTACRERGLLVRQSHRYDAGHLWRLVTVLAVKGADGRVARSTA